MSRAAVSVQTPEIRYLTVAFSKDALRELHGQHEAVRVSRDSIERVIVERGFVSERPVASLLFGLLLVAGGLMALRGIVGAANAGLMRFSARLVTAALTLIPLGAWLIARAFARGTYLRVACIGDSRKLEFKGKVRRDELHEFLARARREFGYEIEDRASGGDEHW